MKKQHWFLCSGSLANQENELSTLRTAIKQLYLAATVGDYRLIFIAPSSHVVGMDKLAIRLSYERVTREVTGSRTVTTTRPGMIVTLVARSNIVADTLTQLRTRIGAITSANRQPQIWSQRLPPKWSMAETLLDELSQ